MALNVGTEDAKDEIELLLSQVRNSILHIQEVIGICGVELVHKPLHAVFFEPKVARVGTLLSGLWSHDFGFVSCLV